MSRSSEWWECECLALRLSASAAVSVLPLRVNLPAKGIEINEVAKAENDQMCLDRTSPQVRTHMMRISEVVAQIKVFFILFIFSHPYIYV